MEAKYREGAEEMVRMCDKQAYHDPFLDDLDRILQEGERFRKALEGDSEIARMVQAIRDARNAR